MTSTVPAGAALQPRLDDVGEPLSAVTFVTVDLETTGGSPTRSAITEIGAVKTRGGDVVGEFQTLVNPGQPIPPMIVALTGITDAMVAPAPRIEEVLPTFLEFVGDAVVVAHNAPFDVGFLKAACRAHSYRWPGNEIVDTVTLARRATTSEEAPNKKLATLARVFGTPVQPNHRALDDARATSQIMHAMFERLAAWGITHREDLDALRNPVPSSIRRKAPMADALPSRPGVYLFYGHDDEVLYVGTSRNIRGRVKSYFTRGEQRRQIREMLEIAQRVEGRPVPTELEANVLELRLIVGERPRYNRRSTRPDLTPWVRLTDEPHPRLAVVRATFADGALGPMASVTEARAAIEALCEVLPVRTCTRRLPANPRTRRRGCILGDIGECAAPCIRGTASGYGVTIEALRAALADDPSPVVEALAARITEHAARLDFERAAALRDGVSAIVAGAAEAQRLGTLRRCAIVAARPDDDSWDIAAIRGGRLVATRRVPARDAFAAREAAAGLAALAEDAGDPPDVPLVEEQQLIAAWLEAPGVRLLHVDGEYAYPIAGAARHLAWVEARRDDRARVWDSYARTDPRI